VRREAWALFGALIIMMTLILLSASILYFLEREAQPEKFGSVPASMWWAVTTLTTIGFGDVVPVTPAGKLAASVFMMFGFAMFALPVGILSSGFAREISRREFAITWHMIMRVPLFRELSPAEQAQIMDLLQSHRYPAGTILMKPGDPADAMYFIASGEVRIDRPGEPPLILKSGDHFGEVALLEQRRRKVRVVVQKHCNLLQLGAQDFEYLMATHPDIAEHIRRIAALRGGGAWQAHDPADPDSGAPDIPHERAPVPPGADLEEEWADDPLADGPAVESVRRPADDPRRP
jgi:voltage-gated potassium channel